MTEIPIKIQFLKTLSDLKPSRMIVVKGDSDTDFKLYVTDKQGMPFPIRDLSISLQNTDGSLDISGTSTTTINISPTLLATINSALQSGDNISELLNDAGYFENIIEKESGENITSYTPIAVIDNKAYKLNASNPLHQFAFFGFSVNGTLIGEQCKIQQKGELTLNGWGLIPNQQYLAGENGILIIENTSTTNFTKVVGYATTNDTLRIIKDYTTLNK